MSTVVIYTRPGTDLHEALCDAFLKLGGWTTIEDSFYEILTMADGWGPRSLYTRWQLRPATAGTA